MSPPPELRHVAMIGPDLAARGGISSVARALLDSPELAGVKVDYVGTMREGNALPKAARIALRQARFVSRLAQGWRPQLFHVHLSWFTSFYRKLPYIQEARLTGAPVLVHVHTPDLAAFWGANRLHAAAMTAVFSQADRCIVLSKAMAKQVRELTEDHPGLRLEVLYNPVLLEALACPPRPDRPDPQVLFMGEIGQRKGAWDLLAAIPRVLDRAPRARFRFCGNGDADDLRARVAAAGLAGSVEVSGWVSGDEKLRAYAEADLLCLPSYQEGLPMSVLEAMGAGLPVVATPIAGVPEAVIPGETGALVPPGDVPALADALTALLLDPGARRRQGAAGQRLAEDRFDVDTVTRQLRQIWTATLAERA